MSRSLLLLALVACVGLSACSDRKASGGDADGGDARSTADGSGDAAGDASGDTETGDPVPGDGNGGDDPPAGDGHGGDPVAGDPGPPACGNEGLCVELRWSSSSGDLDLHLSKEAGNWCSDQACYFGNCKAGAAYRVDWDATVGLSPGDPTLYDDDWGYGPEIISLPDPPAALYTVGVRFEPFGNVPVTATVQIFSDGAVVETFTRSVGPGTFWEVATVTADRTVSATAAVNRYCDAGSWICTDAVGACPP